jgi:hypothetical protein
MLLASACNFILITILEGISFAVIGTMIQISLVQYGEQPVEQALMLVDNGISKLNILSAWIFFTVVRV